MIRGDVKNGGFGTLQLTAQNSVASHLQRINGYAAGLIDLADDFIGRVFNAINPVPPEDIYKDAVKIFRTASDNDLFRRDGNSAARKKMRCNCGTKLRQTGRRALNQNFFLIFTQYSADRTGDYTEREYIIRKLYFHFGDGGRFLMHRKHAVFPIGHKYSGTLPCFDISFLIEQFDCMFDRDKRKVILCRERALAWKAASIGKCAFGDPLTEDLIKGKICRFSGFHLVFLKTSWCSF